MCIFEELRDKARKEKVEDNRPYTPIREVVDEVFKELKNDHLKQQKMDEGY